MENIDCNQELFLKTYDSFEAMLFDGEYEEAFEEYWNEMHQDNYIIKDEMLDLIALKKIIWGRYDVLSPGHEISIPKINSGRQWLRR